MFWPSPANIACFFWAEAVPASYQSANIYDAFIFSCNYEHLFWAPIMSSYYVSHTSEQSSHTFVCRQIFPVCTLSWPLPQYPQSGSKICLHFSSGQGEAEARSRRSLASAGGDQGPHYDDHHPPNITPVGGVPNLKVISHKYPRLTLHNEFHPAWASSVFVVFSYQIAA